MRRTKTAARAAGRCSKALQADWRDLRSRPLARVGRAAGNVVVTPVTAGLTLLSGAGGNVLVAATDTGKVLVDSGAAAFGEAVLATLDELPGGRVTTLFNTHWHLDQVGSNEAFGSAGATIIAHEKTRLRLTKGYYVPTEDRYEKPLPEAARPTKTLHANDTLTVGGRRIEYGYLIEAHTDGDIYVVFPDANVIAVGDVVSPRTRPRARLVRRRLARRTRRCACAATRAQQCEYPFRAELRSRA